MKKAIIFMTIWRFYDIKNDADDLFLDVSKQTTD